jgi:hypothetical protein
MSVSTATKPKPEETKTPMRKVVIRKHPSEVRSGDLIAVPGRNQTLAGLEIGERVTSTQRIKTITPPGTSFPMKYNPTYMCRCKNWHVTVDGSSIPQCWDRAGSIPIVVIVPDEEALYFKELIASVQKAQKERLAQLLQEAHEWTTAMMTLLRLGVVTENQTK